MLVVLAEVTPHPKWQVRVYRSWGIAVGILLIVAHASAFCGAAEILASAVRRNGEIVTGNLIGGAQAGRFAIINQKGIPLPVQDLIQIDFALSTPAIPSPGLRRFVLVTNDVIHGIPILESKQLQPSWSDSRNAYLPLRLSDLDSLSDPNGVRVVDFQGFERDVGHWKSTMGKIFVDSSGIAHTGTRCLPCDLRQRKLRFETTTSPRGCLSFYVCGVFTDAQDRSSPSNGTLALNVLTSGNVTLFQIQLETDRFHFIPIDRGHQWRRQFIKSDPGWHRIDFVWNETSFQVRLDQSLLAIGTPNGKRSQESLTLELENTTPHESALIDDISVMEASPAERTQATFRQEDEITSGALTRLGGTIQSLEHNGVNIVNGKQQTRFPWDNITRIEFANRRGEPKPVRGVISTFLFQPNLNSEELAFADRLRCAWVGLDDQCFIVEHPVFGELRIPTSKVRTIRPVFAGTELQLSGQAIHLGDELKSRFHQPVPRGKSQLFTFSGPTAMSKSFQFELTLTEMEPSGMGTKSHKFLEELRAGGLTSEAWLNSTRLGTLNELITRRATQSTPLTIRLPVHANLLRDRENQFEIRLLPSLTNPIEYDDWELLSVRLQSADSVK